MSTELKGPSERHEAASTKTENPRVEPSWHAPALKSLKTDQTSHGAGVPTDGSELTFS